MRSSKKRYREADSPSRLFGGEKRAGEKERETRSKARERKNISVVDQRRTPSTSAELLSLARSRARSLLPKKAFEELARYEKQQKKPSPRCRRRKRRSETGIAGGREVKKGNGKRAKVKISTAGDEKTSATEGKKKKTLSRSFFSTLFRQPKINQKKNSFSLSLPLSLRSLSTHYLQVRQKTQKGKKKETRKKKKKKSRFHSSKTLASLFFLINFLIKASM